MSENVTESEDKKYFYSKPDVGDIFSLGNCTSEVILYVTRESDFFIIGLMSEKFKLPKKNLERGDL